MPQIYSFFDFLPADKDKNKRDSSHLFIRQDALRQNHRGKTSPSPSPLHSAFTIFALTKNTDPMRASLGKNQRLKSSKQIREIFSERKNVAAPPLRILWSEIPGEGHSLAAFFVPKKYYRHAVERNRIKRLMREVYRTARHQYIGGYSHRFAFIFLWTGHDVPELTTVKSRMDKAFARWREEIDRRNEVCK